MRFVQSLDPVVAALAVALLIGCTKEEPVRLVHLEISAEGVYLLEGQGVAPAALGAALARLKRPDRRLGVELVSAQGSDPAAVKLAIAEAEKAGAVVGFVGNEVFSAASQTGASRP